MSETTQWGSGPQFESFLVTGSSWPKAEVAELSTQQLDAMSDGELVEVIRSATEHESGAKGCFLASSVVASVGQVDGVAERVEDAIADTERRLTARFEREIDKGTLPATFPARERAALLFDIRQGYMFRGRAGLSRECMLKDVPERVAMLLSN